MPSRVTSFVPYLLLVVAVAICGRLSAEPLDRKQLPADVRWFVHVDLDAARQSEVGKTVRSLWLSKAVPQRWLEEFRDATGSDAVNDFHGVTVFNSSFEPDQGIAIIRGEVDQARVLALVSGLPDHRTEMHGSYELHLWTDPRTDRTSAGAFHDKKTVVLGSDADAVRAELDLIDGKGKGLAGERSPLAEPAPAGTFIELAARGLSSAPDLPFESPIVKQCQDLSISLGEKEGRTFLHGRLVINSAEVAGQVRALLDGMRAFAMLKARENPTTIRLLSAVQVTADDRAVRVEWEAANEDVARGIRQQLQKPGPPATQPDERE